MTNSYLRLRRFGFASLVLCLVEILVFGTLIGLVRFGVTEVVSIRPVAACTFLLAVPGSLLGAILGLIFDMRRGLALAALPVSVLCGAFCTLQVLV